LEVRSRWPAGFLPIVTGPDTDPGITQGLIAKRSGPAAQGSLNSFRCTISVSSIVNSLSAVEAAGGKLRSAIVDIPDVGQVAEVADTEDNIVCIIQFKPGHQMPVK
jgi:predicted enzyme related to lactoylglutathione lyase